MTKTAFFDTCIAIAYVFPINSLHSKSKNVLNNYLEYYWSSTVVDEFNGRFYEKQFYLSDFFKDLKSLLENSEKDFYSSLNLINFALKNYSGRKKFDAKSSVEPFWDNYVGCESYIFF